MLQAKHERRNALRSIRRTRHIFEYVKYRACEMMVEGGRFVDGLKAAVAGFFAGRQEVFTVSIYCVNGVCPSGLRDGITAVDSSMTSDSMKVSCLV